SWVSLTQWISFANSYLGSFMNAVCDMSARRNTMIPCVSSPRSTDTATWLPSVDRRGFSKVCWETKASTGTRFSAACAPPATDRNSKGDNNAAASARIGLFIFIERFPMFSCVAGAVPPGRPHDDNPTRKRERPASLRASGSITDNRDWPALLDLAFLVDHVLPDDGVVLLDLHLVRRVLLVLVGGVEVAGVGRGDQADLVALGSHVVLLRPFRRGRGARPERCRCRSCRWCAVPA